jgi:hypothetical protein
VRARAVGSSGQISAVRRLHHDLEAAPLRETCDVPHNVRVPKRIQHVGSLRRPKPILREQHRQTNSLDHNQFTAFGLDSAEHHTAEDAFAEVPTVLEPSRRGHLDMFEDCVRLGKCIGKRENSVDGMTAYHK